MSDYTLKKIYPLPFNETYDNLSYDSEGLWSITHPKDANNISHQIYNIIKDEQAKIVDLTAGCGGNLISFCKYFKNITAVELDINRFEILQNNVNCYQFGDINLNLINGSCLDYLKNNSDKDNIYFIDPPWGGPNYKKNNNLELFLSNTSLPEIISMIAKNKLVVLKVPYNYNYHFIEEKYKLIDTLKIKNMIIIFCQT